MRRILCALLLLAALAGCGDDDGDGTVAGPDAEAAEPELVQIVVITSAGGKVAPRAYFVDDRQEMKDYVKTFENRDDVVEAVRQAVTDAGEREGRLAVATIAIGCDVPPDASIVVTDGRSRGSAGQDRRPDPGVLRAGHQHRAGGDPRC